MTIQDQKPLDFRDYLIRQQEQERMRQQVDALFSKSDEDHAADQADRLAQQAYEAAEACAGRAANVEEALVDVVTQARDLRKKISNGLVSEKDATETLRNLHTLRARLEARTASIKTM
jgi:hypothetical protein